ncbi:glycoside hydrolase family 75 protein [Paenibacillus sp. SC116]|uniref:LysM peptidoglycan-binding domain-containing protein n=1 Tax=Paenibacillus sp. SC116 TaxID=2968986 RepID=UPI00215B5715|nr:LysM peptidoglycan-binding domain-containing protein [Paenibacillus sp. SC116]MCR8846586.1 glycoside hydrolase family 75 protein [Paenibacillus sp. SC116]
MIYTVKPGDSIHHICHSFQVTLEQLMTANRLTVPSVTSGQSLVIPINTRSESHDTETGEADPWEEQNEDDPSRSVVPHPDQTIPIDDPWPEDSRKGSIIATFTAKDLKNKRIPIYLARAAYFFMSKMAVEGEGPYSICDSKRGCPNFFRSAKTPFYVLPRNTNWGSIGDYGVVINTRTKKTTYAIFADWGPDTKIGEGSFYLGRRLDIKDITPNPNQGYEPFGVVYIVFPGSANGIRAVKTVEEIRKEAHEAFKKWGGWPQAKFVLKEHYNITL